MLRIGRWPEPRMAVGSEEYFPAGVMDHRVMGAAEEDAVVEAGRTAFAPWRHVVAVAPLRRTITAGERAAAVADFQGLAELSGEQTLTAADIKRHALAVDEDLGNGRIAGDQLG